MIPAAGRYIACFRHDPEKPRHLNPATMPVEAFSDTGAALVLDREGILTVAAELDTFIDVAPADAADPTLTDQPSTGVGPEPGSIIDIRPDSRWDAGLFRKPGDDTGEDRWIPFIGWAVRVDGKNGHGAYDTEIVPVFLAQHSWVATPEQVAETYDGAVLVRLRETDRQVPATP